MKKISAYLLITVIFFAFACDNKLNNDKAKSNFGHNGIKVETIEYDGNDNFFKDKEKVQCINAKTEIRTKINKSAFDYKIKEM